MHCTSNSFRNSLRKRRRRRRKMKRRRRRRKELTNALPATNIH
jgi:hypothetical protein